MRRALGWRYRAVPHPPPSPISHALPDIPEEDENEDEDRGSVGGQGLPSLSSNTGEGTLSAEDAQQSIDGDSDGRRDSITKIVDAVFELPGIVPLLQQQAEQEDRVEAERRRSVPPTIIHEPNRTLHFIGYAHSSVPFDN
ncbi:hypothetical protein J1614_011561 [Plenodomus biglobosus]|nr:hypothetical protein J1614_011561 [Plenodomus biglobosus]